MYRLLSSRILPLFGLALLPVAVAAQSAIQEPAAAGHRLTLEEALAGALENNHDIQLLRYDRAQQDALVDIARGTFDPALTAGYTASMRETLGGIPPAGFEYSPLDVTTIGRSKSFNFGAARNLEWGGKVKLDYDLDRTRSSTVFSLFPGAASLNPNYTAGLTFSWTQPLLSGFGFTSGKLRLNLARLNRTGTLAQDQELLALRLIEVERAYWGLLSAQDNYRVALEARSLSQRFLDETLARIKAGTIAPIEEVTAEAGVADREESVITAENRWRNAADTLRRLISPGLAAAEGDFIIDAPGEIILPAVNLQEALARAHANRPGRKGIEAKLAQAELNAKAARSGRLPRLDLVSAYGTGGSSGPQDFLKRFDTDPSAPVETATSGAGGANRQAFGRKLENWSVGLNFSYSLFNRAPAASYTDARIDAVKARIALDNYDAGLELEVRTAARDYESSYKRVQAATANRKLQEKKFEAEGVRYANGLSTSYQVLQFQNDLARARSAEVAAVTDYLLARSNLEKATGNYLHYRNITLTDLPVPAR